MSLYSISTNNKHQFIGLSPGQCVLLCFLFFCLFLNGCAREKKSVQERAVLFERELLQAFQQGSLSQCVITRAAKRVPVDGQEQEIRHVKVVAPNLSVRNEAERAIEKVAKRQEFSFKRMGSPKTGTGFVLYEISEGPSRVSSVLLVFPSEATARAPVRLPSEEKELPHIHLPKMFRGDYKVAIIIDDLGSDLGAAEVLCTIPQKVTLSIIPDLRFTRESAELAQSKGKEVMIHLPMEPEAREGLVVGPKTILASMSPQEVESIFDEAIRSVPHAVGMNNHMGSKATANRALMMEVLTLAKLHGLYFVDSRTTPSTEAYAVARELGVPSHFRSVFLDDKADVEYTKNQIDLLLKRMLEHGFAIAIGHPFPSTIAALRARLPEIERRGVKIVFASKLVL